MEEELLTIYSEAGFPVGTAPRSQAHAQGLYHWVTHIWVVSRREDGVWLWYQKRADSKKDFPGYYDTAVGGHISAGEEPLPAALREMQEELGIFAKPQELRFLGTQRDEYVLPGFCDRETAQVFLYENPDPPFQIGEEVGFMVRVSLEEMKRRKLLGAPFVTAYTGEGRRLVIPGSQWCRHPGEFERLILPVLEP